MKKYLAVLAAITVFLVTSVHALASKSEIETTVPSTHTVSIYAEHATALYSQGDKGLSNAYEVPRFSNPELVITAEDGYRIKRIVLNGIDVTNQLTDGALTLTNVYENQVIQIETEEVSTETPPAQTPQPTPTPQSTPTPPVSQEPQSSEQSEETQRETIEQESETEPSGTEENEPESSETESGQEESSDSREDNHSEDSREESEQTTTADSVTVVVEKKGFNFWWLLLLIPAAGAAAGFIFFVIKKRRGNDR